MMPRLILASTSVYRRALLGRLQLDFDTVRPEVDEQARPGESPSALASCLAVEKAATVAARFPDAWVIGSDQVADLDGQALGKPGTHERARMQLTAMSGQTVRFHTAVSLVGPERQLHALDLTEVQLRALTVVEIERYLDAEPALDCAGSFKCEGLGISLFDAIRSEDPTALVGLPMIALARLLRQAGFQIP
ncbi:Maf family nucleotide pyrophosphatase [Xanthomonas citri pv. glycines]|uniref:7-methyl-GTP pyrophosphatase n=1 Tax=Xanthomonas campestris pv. glycines TaxID=473421 RepID=A0AAX0HU94_XANCG|nr:MULTISPECIES: Maf family nucleotide pyrophosphatase [Xanthomonas]AOY63988.1 septum formation inhibitor Maf [Xanthomonas citri pv. glycines str. 8ra]ARV22170.1 septum formation protein Maf [Xanthomonas citri pv. glycines str. 12-2]EWC51525.1 Maf-like protein [Xanthomonas citri pv. glycines str. 8ra]OEY88047.1 septum formation protein Maf [Xanthomonas citri pv. glycines]OOX06925.1 septum formation inhibitor Maf [Xanthomonas citri pv. glycines]